MGFPETVIAEPPDTTFVASTEKPKELGSNITPPIVKGEVAGPLMTLAPSSVLLPPMTIPEVPRLIGNPDTVTPDPPANIVLPATESPVESTVIVSPPAVKDGVPERPAPGPPGRKAMVSGVDGLLSGLSAFGSVANAGGLAEESSLGVVPVYMTIGGCSVFDAGSSEDACPLYIRAPIP